MDDFSTLKEFLESLGFKEERELTFFNKNIMIYFNEIQNQWRIKNTNSYHGMDITSFELPLNEEEKKLIWSTISKNYKEY
ncbi:hypothetical protein [Chryseobacterium balustinum]|uniref:hypothetical protein n=1 Tax=Chryseobacterium balustinum TaxID=246 RepID=UPI003CF9053A